MTEHTMTPITRAFALLTLMGTTAGAVAASCEATSAPTRTPMIALYTSEGCSSCPPADRWLSQLTARTDIVALAFHVDYWDYIGWKDRFGDPRNTARQREWARATHTRTIYTPQILVNGKDAFLWRTKDPLAGLASRPPAQASITLSAKQGSTGTEVAATASSAAAGRLQLVLARYENGHVSEVLEGENHGASLHHDFVVRAWDQRPLVAGTPLSTTLHFPPAERPGGVAAFVENVDTGEVLQAVALPDCTP
jgi:hypothetical protein